MDEPEPLQACGSQDLRRCNQEELLGVTMSVVHRLGLDGMKVVTVISTGVVHMLA